MKNNRSRLKEHKMARFLFNNLGGLLAVAAVLIHAGELKQQVAQVSATMKQVVADMSDTRSGVNRLEIEVAVLKTKMNQLETPKGK